MIDAEIGGVMPYRLHFRHRRMISGVIDGVMFSRCYCGAVYVMGGWTDGRFVVNVRRAREDMKARMANVA